MAANPSTVWANLAGLSSAVGALIFIDVDGATPTIDVPNFFYDATAKRLFVGGAANPVYTRYGDLSSDVASLVTQGPQDSGIAVGLQTTSLFAEHSVTSAGGNNLQVPAQSGLTDLLGKFSGRAYSNLGGATNAFNRHATIEMYTSGITAGNPGGKIVFKTKADGNNGALNSVLTLDQNLQATFGGVVSVSQVEPLAAGNLVLGLGAVKNATDTTGYIMHPSVLGKPTGVPVGVAQGAVPIIWDDTNQKLAVYSPTGAKWVESAAFA